MIKLDYLSEPKLQFGQFFEHEDSKTGLAEFGPFGKNIDGLHPSEIKLGFIGTAETIAGAKDWINECGSFIESENIKTIKTKADEGGPRLFADEQVPEAELRRIYKILNRDFVGFSPQTQWACAFRLNPRWERTLRPADINPLLKIEDKRQRIEALVGLLDDQIKSLAKTHPVPTVIVIALTPQIEAEAEAVRVSGNFYFNLRRAIKARAMKWGVPIQLIRRNTVLGQRAELQEKATRAWNFCTGLYYKADGVPWRPTQLSPDTCYVGIDFYVAADKDEKLSLRSSVSQAFDYLGQGVVLRGDPFEWDAEKYGRSPHMTTEGARKLIRRTLDEYVNVRGAPPRRVVIHKSSMFWGAEHPEFNELDGLHEGIYEVFSKCETDFVTLRQSGIRLFREGQYPPLRGTYFSVRDKGHFVYTMGYIPYLETSPSSYVPEPWEMVDHHGGTSPKDLMREVLVLTKMNVNNCSYADGRPITLAFSQKVGEVMKHIPPGEEAQTGYKFYM